MEYKPALRFKRITNLIIDLICAQLSFSLIVFGLTKLTNILSIDLTEKLTISLPMEILNPLWLFTYYVLMEKLFGKTLGKFFTGTKVISFDGTSPSWIQVIARSLLRMVLFGIEFFSFLKDRPIGWHDSITETIVITD
ncbi:MAG: RDD family protein [Bacteroidota bacterium]